MTTSAIANEINARQSYKKRDGSPVTRFQIHGRTRKYPQLFVQSGSTISLAEWRGLPWVPAIEPNLLEEAPRPSASEQSLDLSESDSEVGDKLIDSDEFRPAGAVDLEVPDHAGLYAIRVRDRSALLAPFSSLSERSGHDLLYIGIARISLKTRFLNQELRAKGNGTFFRSIGAVLGYRPAVGSLIGKENTRNYTFAPADEVAIIGWINQNLLVNWIALSDDHVVAERALLRKHLPLLNILGNPAALPELSALRADCVRVANLPI